MHIPTVNSMNLRHKFFLWSGLILVLFSLLLSLLYYRHMKSILIRESLDKSEVILQEVEAIREYVKKELRPKIQALHKDDTFILEAMSTTYVSLRIMKLFGKRMPGYVFRRVSMNPLNPENRADSFEEEMFDWFEEHPDRHFWQGIVHKKGRAFFISMEPDYLEISCLRCHGDYQDAPKELVKRYGTSGGFRFQEGDLGGIDSVLIPVSASLARIVRDSILVFVVIFGSAMCALFLLNLMFGKLVIARLARVSESLFQEGQDKPAWLEQIGRPQQTHENSSLRHGQSHTPREFSEKNKKNTILEKKIDADELENLRLSLKTLSRYVKIARKGAGIQPDFIGSYIVGSPLAPGTLSWLYQGMDTGTDRKVILKLGFDEVLINPLYAACLHAEAKIFRRGICHENILVPLHPAKDLMVFEKIEGTALHEWLEIRAQALQGKDHDTGAYIRPVFEQLCSLCAALHWDGIVHHDLRPQVFLITADNRLKLFDMGHAFHRDTPDVILASGLGPQGDFRYMAPELIQGRRGDPRSDIYSLGVLLFLFAAGQLPFERRNVGPNTWLRIKQEIIAPHSFRADISLELEKVILRAMAPDTADRYQWVEDLWEDLQKATE